MNESFKIKVTPKQSEIVQKVMIRRGWVWSSSMDEAFSITDGFLYFKPNKEILSGWLAETFETCSLTELTFDEFSKLYNVDILPEKWCVRNPDNDESQLLYDYTNSLQSNGHRTKSKYRSGTYFHFPSFGGGRITSSYIEREYVLISFEKFKRLVLSEHIVGYKLIAPKYKTAACTIGNSYLSSKYGEYIVCDKSTITNLKRAGVLDLWFAPMYKFKHELNTKITDKSPLNALPERWCIKITEENRQLVGDYYNREGNTCYGCPSHIGRYYTSHNHATDKSVMGTKFGSSFSTNDIPRGRYVEITFEQFKMWVLGHSSTTSDMNTSKPSIVGYEFVRNEYKKMAFEIGDFNIKNVKDNGTEYWYNEYGYLPTIANKSINNLRNANVLDVWFKPIYKHQPKFILPERWCIKVTEENRFILHDWLISKLDFNASFTPIKGWVISSRYDGSYQNWNMRKPPTGYTEITIDQFKQYVLNQSNV